MRRPLWRRRGNRSAGRRSHHRWGGSSRGQSTTLDYTLALGVAALAVTGLVAAAGDFVNDQREQVVRTELDVVGEQLADRLVAADRLVQSGDQTDRLVVNATMPNRVAGVSYTVSVNDTGSSRWLNLTSHGPEVTVPVKLDTRTDVANTSVSGGNIAIVYDPTADELEVRS